MSGLMLGTSPPVGGHAPLLGESPLAEWNRAHEEMAVEIENMRAVITAMQNEFRQALELRDQQMEMRDQQNARLVSQLRQLEETKGYNPTKTTWVTLKMLTPEPLKSVATWKNWKARTLAYLNTATPGMQEELDKVTTSSDMSEQWMRANVESFHRSNELFQALITFTADEARRIVEAENGKGFHAWKALVQYYEPATKTLDIHVWTEFLKERSRAKTPAETKKKLLDIEEGISKIRATLSDAPQEKLLIGMVHSVMDHATFNALGKQLLCESMTYAETRDLVVSMCNATANMHKVEAACVVEAEQNEWIEAVENRTCFYCGKAGHLQSECR